MPQLDKTLMLETAKTRFQQYKLTLPTIVPTGRPPNIQQFLQQRPTASIGTTGAIGAVKLGAPIGRIPSAPVPKRPTGTPLRIPPALIDAASNDKVDVDFQTEVNTDLGRYFDGICQAIALAHGQWKQGACLRGVKVNAIIATGGRLDGPSLSPIIQAQPIQAEMFAIRQAYTQAIAEGLEACWRNWQNSVSVPNLPWYPAFVAVPTKSAPPLPNVPTPLVALTQNAQAMSRDNLVAAMKSRLSAAPYTDELFASIATGIAAAVTAWIPLQVITNAMGTGPAPTFAPPYVPVAPVIDGHVVENPNIFAL